MKYAKKTISVFLATAIFFSLVCVSVFNSEAVTKVTYGDFDFAVMDDEETLQIFSYHGESADIVLPQTAGNKTVTGIYSNCFEDSLIESVIIPDTYTNIGSFAFSGCGKLKSVVMPSMLKTIGTMAFYGCKKLESVNFEKVTRTDTIPFGAFSGCESLTEVTVPDCVSKLGGVVFSNCTSISSVTLSQNITEIPEHAFYNCPLLSGIEFPDGIKIIGESAFEGCSALTGLDFANSITQVGEKAFYNAGRLNSLFIPDTVTEIGADAFAPMSYNGKIEITCYKESYAYDYCYDNNVNNLLSIDKFIGDANLDNEVNILDVTHIQKYKIGKAKLQNNRAKALADVNNDGNVSVRDATMIQMYIAKILTEL